MSVPFLFGTAAQSLDETDAQTFFRVLTHDERDSFYCIACRTQDGRWVESFVRSSGLYNYSIFDDTCDWYMTRNGFTQRARKTERLRQANAVMFDLDCHSGDARTAVSQGLTVLATAVEKGSLPEPNLVVDTGRGLHVYYVLDRSTAYRVRGGELNERGLTFFRDVERKLTGVVSSVIEGTCDLELDEAVFDFARVSRIPGTFNTAAGVFARLVHVNERYYALSELSAYGSIAPKVLTSKPSGARMLNFDKLSLSRVGKIFELQKMRDFKCEGDRELMCFCLYNAAVQVFSDKDDARAKLIEFNANFVHPLPNRDLEQIIRSVSKVGFYRMRAETIVSKLHMSSHEIEGTRFFESQRKIEREKAKRATAEKRAARNARILQLYALPGATFESVAQTVGVCKRTVASVLHAARKAVEAVSAASPQTLKEAALAALKKSSTEKCKFLANDFKSCGLLSSSESFIVCSSSVLCVGG